MVENKKKPQFFAFLKRKRYVCVVFSKYHYIPMDPMIINDPVYGFIKVPRGLLCDIISHPYFQRLGRIRQLGMASIVYPGAVHTRKQHSLGAFSLMQEALNVLAEKGEFIFKSEIEAAEAAILLHDIGHGPFSHVLEDVLIKGVKHEQLTLLMMRRMNEQLHGELSLAIQVFTGEHYKPFLHELVCSQLDVDRLDYLCRDSFYCGVIEGNIGAARIIKMLNVSEGKLVFDEKGIYSIEHYLMARRLMYWQVYLHKTVVAAEHMLCGALRRAKELTRNGEQLFASEPLQYFLAHDVKINDFDDNPQILDYFVQLDDNDIFCALKSWSRHKDKVLSNLASGFLNRDLFKAKPVGYFDYQTLVDEIKQELAIDLNIPLEDTEYYITQKNVSKEMYVAKSHEILLMNSGGKLSKLSNKSNILRDDLSEISDSKSFLIYPSIYAIF